jgi:ABC-type multidrug transport system ATPase subunit
LTAVIEVEALRKSYRHRRGGQVWALDGLELSVRAGGVFGFLGPNGSGKTTTIRCLLGLARPTSGQCRVLGLDSPGRLPDVIGRIGALVEAPGLNPGVSGREALNVLAATAGIGRHTVDATLERVGLAERSDDLVRGYSLGMRQRLGIAIALLKDPELLVLDEPANGLDPAGIREVRELVRRLGAEGRTVFLSSHLLGEVEQLCTRVGVMDRGRLVVQEELAALRAPTGRIVLRTADPDRAVALLDGHVEDRAGDRLVVRHADVADLNAWLVGEGIRVTEIAVERRTLEDVVLEHTGAGSDRVDSP